MSQQTFSAFLKRVAMLPQSALVGTIRIYQWVISPLLGPSCRFRPTCSEYFIKSVRKHGIVYGSFRGARRIMRCHPWHPGGYDPP